MWIIHLGKILEIEKHLLSNRQYKSLKTPHQTMRNQINSCSVKFEFNFWDLNNFIHNVQLPHHRKSVKTLNAQRTLPFHRSSSLTAKDQKKSKLLFHNLCYFDYINQSIQTLNQSSVFTRHK